VTTICNVNNIKFHRHGYSDIISKSLNKPTYHPETSLKSIFIYIGIFLIKLLSLLPLSIAQAFGGFIGRLMWWFNSSGANVARINIRHCYPNKTPQELDQLAKQSLIAYGKTIGEMGMSWNWSIEKVKKKITKVEGLSYLTDALESKKGIILIAPHHGNWEILNHFFSQYFCMTIMYKPAKIKALDDYILKTRKRIKVNLAPANRRGVAMIFKSIKKGDVVAILPDQEPAENSGVYAQFFDQSALTGKLVCQMAHKTEASLLCCYAKRLVDGTYCAVIKPANELIRNKDELVAANALNKDVEMCISDCPEQYQWVYKRFTWQSSGRTPFYRKKYKTNNQN